jgi:chemotaxis protein methyltransferase WspC
MDGVNARPRAGDAGDPLAALMARLCAESGFSPDSVTRARGAIELHLSRRARELGLAAGGDAIALVAALAAREPAEYARVESLVAPPETWLFRAPESFAWLRDRARARAAARRGFRALVVGAGGWCEPCSAAAAVLAGFSDASRAHAADAIEVVAVDRDASLFARPMRFAGMELRGGVPPWAERFFPRVAVPVTAPREAAEVREASPEVAACLRSARATVDDVVAGGARARAVLAGDAPFDAVFFRNVAIYLADPVRERAFAGLARLLADDGVLFVGHAEVEIAARATGLASVEASGVFALMARRSVQSVAVAQGTGATQEPRAAGKDASRVDQRVDQGAAPRIDPRANPAHRTPAPIAHPAREPRDAAWYLAEALREEAALDLAAARAAVAKALYLDPRHEEALLAAARLAEAAGDGAAAERFRARALRAHLGKARDEDRA